VSGGALLRGQVECRLCVAARMALYFGRCRGTGRDSTLADPATAHRLHSRPIHWRVQPGRFQNARSPASQFLPPLLRGFALEEWTMHSEWHAVDSLVAGLSSLITAVVVGPGRHRLPARVSETMGQFTASYRAFRDDLRQLLQSIAGDRRGLVWLSIIALAAIAVRIWYLDQPIRYDEAWTFMRFVALGGDRLFDYPAPNNHVAHTLLVYLSTSAFGIEPWAIRIPAFLAGILLVPLTFVCARTMLQGSSGLVAAGLVAASPFLVLYSTYARGYTIIVLLTVVLVPLCLYFVRTESSFAGCLVALLAALGLYTIPIMLLPMTMLAVWALFLAYQAGGRAKTLRVVRAGAWVLLLCAAVTLALYAPVFVTSGARRVFGNQYVEPRGLGEAVASWPGLAWETWVLYLAGIPGWAQVFLGACLLAGAVTLWKANRAAFLLIPAAAVGAGLALLATRNVPYPRTWIYLLPLSFCLADAGVKGILARIARPSQVHVAGALGVLLAVGMSYSLVAAHTVPYPDTDTIPDAEAIVRYLQPRLKEGDWVQVRKFWPLRYYAYRLGMPIEVFGKSSPHGDGDIYVVVLLPNGSFEKATKPYGTPLDEADFTIEAFPSSLLYVPRHPGE
jgi:hypothetical protein